MVKDLPVVSRSEGARYIERLETTPAFHERTHSPKQIVAFEMVPIPAGEFLMGGPNTQPGHQPSESPQHRVRLDAFWMSSCEVTWELYNAFRYSNAEFLMRYEGEDFKPTPRMRIAVNAMGTAYPVPPYYYGPPTEPGADGLDYPVTAVTPYAAQMFCRWLTIRTGHVYRLPTEAEWEYAARAGTTTAYFFGDDPSRLPEYAWFGQKTAMPHAVGIKKPNPWGLHDIYGNVAEWTLDGWSADYSAFADDIAANPWVRIKIDSRADGVVRGGSSISKAKELRSASRRKSIATGFDTGESGYAQHNWNNTSDAGRRIGFRIVSPVRPGNDGREVPVKLDPDAM